MRRPGLLVVSLSLLALFLLASPAWSRTHGLFVVELTDGSRWTAVDSPVVHGSVMTFRTPDGTLMGVPREMIRRISSGSAGVTASIVRSLQAAPATVEELTVVATTETVPAEALQPGDLVVLGPLTEQGQTLAESAAAAAPAGTGAAGALSPGATGYGGYGGANNPKLYVSPNGTLSRAPSSTDLALALAAQTPIGSNGFPVTSNGLPTVIGPDGTPTLAPGVPGSSTPAIGPNGTPIIGETGAATFPPIGPNGTSVLAPSGQPGAGQPVIGPNGTPVLAPAGGPGFAPVVIGPNGTPVLAPAGQAGTSATVIGPNGTPVLAPAGQAGSVPVVIGPNGMPAAAAMRGAAPAAPSGSGGGHR